MPIYEYLCARCRHRFEQLIFGSDCPVCPKCSGTELEKQLSTFAVSSKGAPRGGGAPDSGEGGFGGGPGACGSCGDPRGPGACDLD